MTIDINIPNKRVIIKWWQRWDNFDIWTFKINLKKEWLGKNNYHHCCTGLTH